MFIANRIKTVLPLIRNEDHAVFMSGRYIGENIRTLSNLFHYTENNKIVGLRLLIDFEKAFESVSWLFILKILVALLRNGFKCFIPILIPLLLYMDKVTSYHRIFVLFVQKC